MPIMKPPKRAGHVFLFFFATLTPKINEPNIFHETRILSTLPLWARHIRAILFRLRFRVVPSWANVHVDMLDKFQKHFLWKVFQTELTWIEIQFRFKNESKLWRSGRKIPVSIVSCANVRHPWLIRPKSAKSSVDSLLPEAGSPELLSVSMFNKRKGKTCERSISIQDEKNDNKTQWYPLNQSIKQAKPT